LNSIRANRESEDWKIEAKFEMQKEKERLKGRKREHWNDEEGDWEEDGKKGCESESEEKEGN
jgi:hypothetical protein